MEREMVDVSVRELVRSDLRDAGGLVGRGMRDNPLNVRAFGSEPEHRGRAMTRFFGPVLRGLYHRGSILGAFCGPRMLGVCGMAPPGRCQPTLAEKFGILPTLCFGNAIGVPLRVLRWTSEWARRDPPQAHWHLGPVAVDPDVQGQGIGRAMLERFCAQMDEGRAVSYLETDKHENVRFYGRFGYAVVAEGFVLGVRNWFMTRHP